MEIEFTPIVFKNGKFRPYYKSKAYSLWYYYQNHEKMKADKNRRYNNSYKEHYKKYRDENHAHEIARSANWRAKNPNYMSNYMKARRKNKPGLVKTEERLKDIKRKQRFIFNHLLHEINDIYKKCQENQVVDHIIPLQGENVSGLHVPWNLQILNKDENNFKRNKFDGTYENNSWRLNFNE